VEQCKVHSDALVAKVEGLDDRSAAESLKGARIFLPRSAFAATASDEYYWVDLIGLQVVNREGVALGTVRDLMATGPHSVLVIEHTAPGDERPQERMIPFVSAFIDAVDLPGRRITVDWQPEY
jgi:16S rRNA processing protein RimM